MKILKETLYFILCFFIVLCKSAISDNEKDVTFYLGFNMKATRNITHNYTNYGISIDFKCGYYWILYAGFEIGNFRRYKGGDEWDYTLLGINFIELRYPLLKEHIPTLGKETILLYTGADYLFLSSMHSGGFNFDKNGMEYHAGINVYWFFSRLSYFYFFDDSSHNLGMVWGIRFSW